MLVGALHDVSKPGLNTKPAVCILSLDELGSGAGETAHGLSVGLTLCKGLFAVCRENGMGFDAFWTLAKI